MGIVKLRSLVQLQVLATTQNVVQFLDIRQGELRSSQNRTVVLNRNPGKGPERARAKSSLTREGGANSGLGGR
ncbi:hypothetical protein CR513_10395, partial [Mucuna pruriens]